MAFADSFDSLQSARQRIADANASNYFRQSDQDEKQYMDDAAIDRQQADYLSGLRRDQLNRDFAQHQQDFSEGETDKKDALNQSYFDLAGRNQAFQESSGTPAQIRDKEFKFNAAQAAAQRGEFGSPDDVLSFNPDISPDQAKILADQSAEVRKQQGASYGTAKQIADTLNAYTNATNGFNTASSGHNNFWFNQKQYDPDAAAKAKKTVDALAEYVSKVKSRKDFAQLVGQDPDSGKYIPLVPVPRSSAAASSAPEQQNYFVQSGGTTTGQDAPQSPQPEQSAQQPKTLTADIAQRLLQQSGGDKNKARALANSLGYTW